MTVFSCRRILCPYEVYVEGIHSEFFRYKNCWTVRYSLFTERKTVFKNGRNHIRQLPLNIFRYSHTLTASIRILLFPLSLASSLHIFSCYALPIIVWRNRKIYFLEDHFIKKLFHIQKHKIKASHSLLSSLLFSIKQYFPIITGVMGMKTHMKLFFVISLGGKSSSSSSDEIFEVRRNMDKQICRQDESREHGDIALGNC